MLNPRSVAWSPLQKWLILGAATLGLIAGGTFIGIYERYHRGPSESALYGTWERPDELYYQFYPDHTFSVVSSLTEDIAPDIIGRWYAGGPNIYLRYPEDIQGDRRPIVWHIVDITPNELRVRLYPDDAVYIYHRVDPVATRASNQAMQRTAGRSAF